MASKLMNIALAVFAIVLPAVAMAIEFTVGDDQGQTINFDYEAWVKDKVFRVGDELGNVAVDPHFSRAPPLDRRDSLFYL